LLQIVQSLKAIRSQAIAILKDVSASLVTVAEKEGKPEKRAAFVDAAKPLVDSGVCIVIRLVVYFVTKKLLLTD
jgi:hypothetical protein